MALCCTIQDKEFFKCEHIYCRQPLFLAPFCQLLRSSQLTKKCLKASDYKGCIEVTTGESASKASATKSLVESMKLLPSRISNSSRRDLYGNIQPFSDALARASSTPRENQYQEEVYAGAIQISRLIDIMAETWSDQISLRIRYKNYMDSACENALSHVNRFNSVAGSSMVSYREWTEKVLWQTSKKCSNPTPDMARAIDSLVNSVTEDPAVKKERLAKAKRERELAEMAPWVRHLEENPDLKKWAEANPKAAEKAKEKFLEKNSK